MNTRIRLGLRGLFVIVMSMSMVALAGCSGEVSRNTSSGDATAGKEGPVKIGILMPLTGIFSAPGQQGEWGLQEGLKYATDGTMKVDGRDIEVTVRDDGSTTDGAVSFARELVSKERVHALFGPMSSAGAKAVQADLADRDVVIMSMGSAPEVTAEWFTKNTFRIDRNIAMDTQVFAAHWAEKKPDAKWVLIAPASAVGQSAVKSFHQAVSQTSMTFAKNSDIMVDPTTTDFTTTIGSVRSSGATNVAVLWVPDSPALVQQLHTNGIDKDFAMTYLMTSETSISQAYKDAAGAFAGASYMPGYNKNKSDNFLIDLAKKKYNRPPTMSEAMGFATSIAFIEALKVSKDASTPALIDALENLKFDSPIGDNIGIRKSDHQVEMPFYEISIARPTDPDGNYFDVLRVIDPKVALPKCNVPIAGRC